MKLQNICLYNSRIYFPLIHNFELFLTSYVHKSSDENFNSGAKFRDCSKIKIPLNCNAQPRDIWLKVVNHFTSELKCILIVVFDNYDVCQAVIYNDLFLNKFYKISLPEWNVHCIPNTNLLISDGPSFFAFDSNKVCLYLSTASVAKVFRSNFLFSESNVKIIQFICFGISNSVENAFLLISSSNNDVNIHGFITSPGDVHFKRLPVNLFFSENFSSVIKAVSVIELLLLSEDNFLSLDCVCWTQNKTIIFTVDDCLVYYHGELKYCVKLNTSFLEMTYISINFFDLESENKKLILTSENNMVFLISIIDTKKCEVIKAWTNIAASLFGDILLRGSRQLLLLKNTEFNNWQEDSILIDPSSFLPIDLDIQHEMPDDCLKATISGLQKKVEAGKLIVKQTEAEISQKNAATITALLTLNECKKSEILKKPELKSFQESLVDLILHNGDNQEVEMDVSNFTQTVKLLKLTQRVIDGYWIINVQCRNESEKVICNPVLKTVIEGKEIQTVQKLFVHNLNDVSVQDKGMGEIDKNTSFSVVCSYKLPVFSKEFEEVFFVLSWFYASVREFDRELLNCTEEKRLLQDQICFSSKLDVAMAFSCNREKGLCTSEDLLFFKASQKHIVLHISFLLSNIKHLENLLLKEEMNSTNMYLLEDNDYKCLIFTNMKSPLFGTNIVFKNTSEKHIEVQAFSKGETEFSLLLHYLYRQLPDDAVISYGPYTSEDSLNLKKNAICAMKDEVELLMTALNIYNVSDTLRVNYSELLNSYNVGKVIIPKKMFYKIRKDLIRREMITDSVMSNLSYHVRPV